jgi:hypothetical protein
VATWPQYHFCSRQVSPAVVILWLFKHETCGQTHLHHYSIIVFLLTESNKGQKTMCKYCIEVLSLVSYNYVFKVQFLHVRP